MSERQFLVTGDGSHTLFLPELNETYHSTHGAIRESEHVFIENGLEYFADLNTSKIINVFEIGFGTGLNALLSVLFSERHKIPVGYESIEAYPLSIDEAQKLNYPKLISEGDAQEVFNKIHEASWDESVAITADFTLKKIKNVIQDQALVREFDVCFFDAFAPSKQPDMWEREILEKIYDAMVIGGVFVTYCAKGQLKRDLRSIGFEVETLPGPPGKKEMVRGIKI